MILGLLERIDPATKIISGEISPKYQWTSYSNEINTAKYGRLYTWYAVTDDRNICPIGWHVLSYEKWITLTDYLKNNGYGYRGSKSAIAKSMASKLDWTISSREGTPGNDKASNNRSGFSGLPSGHRDQFGSFEYIIGSNGYWWCSSKLTTEENGIVWGLHYDVDWMDIFGFYKYGGFSVRCIINN